jgi:hypothetical protein
MSKPSIFIGSSSEGLEFARAARSLLTQDAEITLWNEGFFTLGSTYIEALVNGLPRFDFALLVLTPDDLVNSRDVETLSPRDNVIFELGLFMGHLGRARTFILQQANAKIKIPSDLSGITTATYEWPREDKSYTSALGAACDTIRAVVRDLGVSEAKAARAISEIRSRQDRQENQLVTQQAEIRSLQVALQGIVTAYELDKLEGLSKDGPFLCYYSDEFHNELRRLRGLNLIQNHPGMTLTSIRDNYRDRKHQFDLKQYCYITEQGIEYLKLRNLLQATD